MSRSGAAYMTVGAVPGSVMAAGRYYGLATTALGTNVPAEGRLTVGPLYLPRAVTIDRIAAEVTSGGTVGAVVRLGIYADNGSGRPGALVSDAGTIDGTSATVQEITVNLAVAAGLVWVGSCVQGAAGTRPTMRALAVNQSPPPFGYASSSALSVTHQGYEMTAVAGAFSDPFTFAATNITAVLPRVMVRVQ